MTSPLPDPETSALERFAVYSRAEIVGWLRQLLDEAVLINVYYGNGSDALLTAILAIDPTRGQVVIDSAPDEQQQRRLLEARDLKFVAFHRGVKMQFGAARAEATLHDGRAALRVALPQRLIRLQRRDYFRVRPLATRPVTCTVRDEEGEVCATWNVLDVSSGGLALACDGERSPYALGDEVRDCTIDFPGQGKIVSGLRVRSIAPMPRDGKLRIGCEFVFVAPQAQMLVQRYIHFAEAEQHKCAPRRRPRE